MRKLNKLSIQIVFILLLISFGINKSYSQCLLTVPPGSLNYSSSAGTITFEVSLAKRCSLSISDNQSWISTSVSSGQVSISVTENTGAARTGIVTMEIFQIQIYQEGAVPPTPGAIVSSGEVCVNGDGHYSISPVSGADSYTWSIPSGASISSGQGTVSIDVTFGTSSGDVKVKANNFAGSSAYSTLPVSLKTLPISYSVTGGGSYCSGGSGVLIGLSDSQYGVVFYQLKRNGSNVGSPITGTGSAISFGNQTVEGDYTVEATNSYGCIKSMSGSKTVTVNPMPTLYTMTGDGSYCSGSSGASISLSDSEVGVTYYLLRDNNLGESILGTGSPITFQNQTNEGNYTVEAHNSNGCSRTMSGSVNVSMHSLPVSYSVTGGGSYCEEGIGKLIGLSDSQLGVSYQLVRGSINVGSAISGTGSAIDFGNITTEGVYTVVATNSAGCSQTMSGSQEIIINSLPEQYQVTGGDFSCNGSVIGLSNSQTNVTYQLKLNGTNIGSPIGGTGSAISFGNQTTEGIYMVSASNTDGCSRFMSSTITVYESPNLYTVTGGGSFCIGESGVPINLSGSEVGVTYQLKRDNAQVGQETGTGSSLSFGNYTTDGTYTVTATSSVGCVSQMNGNAVVTTTPLPIIYTITGNDFYYVGEPGTTIGLDGSESGVSYTLIKDANHLVNTIQGTGSAINFGNQTAGTYAISASNGCTVDMEGGKTIIIKPVPTAYSVSGGGVICDGSDGLSVDLDGSDPDVHYILLRDGNFFADDMDGTGNAISFENLTQAGTYTIDAVYSDNKHEIMDGSAVITVNPLPQQFSVTGGGLYCIGNTGNSIDLDGSEIGIKYQLKKDDLLTGSEIQGTGSAISFSNLTEAGTYTILATNVLTECVETMDGNAIITTKEKPIVYSVIGDGYYIDGEPGVPVDLSGSEPDVTYTLIKRVKDIYTILSNIQGTGSVISFGNQTTGTYTVTASNGCPVDMEGSATIVKLPAPFMVTGGGIYCEGGNGHSVGLDGSEIDVIYKLKRDNIYTGSEILGTGNAIDFVNQTIPGIYTIDALYADSEHETMNGSATIIRNDLPNIYSVIGGGAYCEGSEGSSIELENSEEGILYDLMLDDVATGTQIEGTGSTISFGNQLLPGVYTVLATNPSTSCSVSMPENLEISITSIPSIPVSVVGDERIEAGLVNLSAQPGAGGDDIRWYSENGKYKAHGTTYSPELFETKSFNVKTYNTTTGCESESVSVMAVVNGMFNIIIDDQNSNSKNYSRIITPKVPIEYLSELNLLTTDQVVEQIKFSDGLGRALQSQVSGTGDLSESIVQFYSMDEFGRADTSFLPFTHKTEGKYLEDVRNTQLNYYKNGSSYKIAVDTIPFATVKFENTPLSRVLESSSVGEFWQIKDDNTGITSRLSYLSNESSDSVIKWRYDNVSGSYIGDLFYEQGKLIKNVVTDENGKTATSYSDRDGKLILKDQMGLKTYYIYDVLGRVRHVLPPEFVENMATINNTIDTSATLVKQYCYTYVYGERSLLIEKHIPGIEKIEYIYDKINRPVLSRNGNLRNNNQWSFVKYDKYGRVAYSGIYTDADLLTREQLQNTLFGQENIFETYSFEEEYSNNVFPYNNLDIHVYNIYDEYPEIPEGFVPAVDIDGNEIYPYHNTKYFINEAGEEETTYNVNTLGKLTISKVKILDGSETPNYLETVVYYDKYNRVIQKHSDNIYEKVDIVNMTYNFMGQVTEQVVEHGMPGEDNIVETVSKYFNYDHASRLKSVEQEIEADTDNGRVKMLEMEYNRLGQVVAKKLHETADENFLQTIDYLYNIRGWMTHINDPNEQGADKDLFAMRMYYKDQVTATAQTLNNGMISGIEWNIFDSKVENKKRAYAYNYDDHYRLTEANYFEGDNLNENIGRYNVDYSYTANGKINTLVRNGKISENTYGIIDNLTYTYEGNQLIKVEDSGVTGLNVDNNFADLADLEIEYEYDANGNMYSDENKGLANITYNHLNLPEHVEFDSNNYIDFIYSAGGSKLEKHVVMDGVENVFTFVGGFIYKNDVLEQISTETGQVLITDNTYKYQYFLKDHLGSIRVMFEDNAGEAVIIQETHYYPYGMRIDGLSFIGNSSNTKLFSGKEINSEKFNGVNLNWYDFHARNYDPQLGMWFNVDPLAEAEITNTPYNYCANNPVNYTDPTGMKKSNKRIDYAYFDFIDGLNARFGRGGGGGGGRLSSAFFKEHFKTAPKDFLKDYDDDDDDENKGKYDINDLNGDGILFSATGSLAQEIFSALIMCTEIKFSSDGPKFVSGWIQSVYSRGLGGGRAFNYFFNEDGTQSSGSFTQAFSTVEGGSSAQSGGDISNPGIVYKDKFEKSFSMNPNFIMEKITLTLGKTHTIGEGNIVMTSTNGKPPKRSFQRSYGSFKLAYSSNSFSFIKTGDSGGYSLTVSGDGVTSGFYRLDGNNWSSSVGVTIDYNWKNIGLLTVGVTAAVLAPQIVVTYPELVPAFGF